MKKRIEFLKDIATDILTHEHTLKTILFLCFAALVYMIYWAIDFIAWLYF